MLYDKQMTHFFGTGTGKSTAGADVRGVTHNPFRFFIGAEWLSAAGSCDNGVTWQPRPGRRARPTAYWPSASIRASALASSRSRVGDSAPAVQRSVGSREFQAPAGSLILS